MMAVRGIPAELTPRLNTGARKRQAVARRGSFQPGRTKWQV